MTAPDIARLLDAENRRGDALVARDFATLRALISPDISHTHTRGVTDDFAGYFRFVEEKIDFLECTRGTLDIRLFGTVAVMSGPMHNIVRPRGSDAPVRTDAQVLQVWEWRAGRWIMVAFQSTSLPG